MRRAELDSRFEIQVEHSTWNTIFEQIKFLFIIFGQKEINISLAGCTSKPSQGSWAYLEPHGHGVIPQSIAQFLGAHQRPAKNDPDFWNYLAKF